MERKETKIKKLLKRLFSSTTEKQYYYCPLCTKDFNCQTQLNLHLKYHHKLTK